MNYIKKTIMEGEVFYKISIHDYLQKLNEKYVTLDSWQSVISPPAKAKELYDYSNGCYSKVWHGHCQQCWKTFTAADKEFLYISEDGITIFCEQCFDGMQTENEATNENSKNRTE